MTTKKQLVARGILGSLSLCGVLGLVGCGAEMGDQGAAGEGEIGSAEQAVRIGSPAFDPGKDLAFGGYTKFTDTVENNGVEKVLWAGGMHSNGTIATDLALFNPSTPAWIPLEDGNTGNPLVLPTALKEPDVAAIPGQTNKFLVAGGRTSNDGAGSTLSYVVTLNSDASGILKHASVSTAINMGTGRVLPLHSLKPCGTGSRLIAIGGMTNAGFLLTANSATDVIEVFDFNGGAPTWSTLKQTVSGTDRQVKLQEPRGYHEVFDVDANNFVIAGGSNQNDATAINSSPSGAGTSNVELLTVDNNCKATSADDLNGGVGTPDMRTDYSPRNMPAPRARMASLKKTITVSNVAYDFVISGGNNRATSPFVASTTAFLYDVQTDTWTTICSNMAGKVYARSAPSGTSSKFVTGIIPQAANPFKFLQDSTAVVDVISNTGTCTTATALTDDRAGSFAAELGGTDYLGLGFKYTAGAAPVAVGPFETF